MIYIISEKTDLITDLVTEWLSSKKKKFTRINDDVFLNSTSKIQTSFSDTSLFKNASKIWQRRGGVNFIPDTLFHNFSNRHVFLNYFNRELNVYNSYLENHLKRKLKSNYIGSLDKEIHTDNKLINLEIAKEVGLKIPSSLITSDKEDLQAFYNKYKKIITKDLRGPIDIKTRNKHFVSTGVKVVDSQMIAKLDKTFIPIYVQNFIAKEYEVRVFVFDKQLFSMAIFSQNDKKTQIDYRNYNRQKPNRCVPVLLPKTIEEKIWRFMDKIDMNTGSIDLIVTPQNEYYFLEINPMGQFHWVSANCNYYIEEKIAKFLANEKT